MARELVVRCDQCGKDGATSFEIQHLTESDGGARRWVVDLCTEHGEAVLVIAALGKEVEPGSLAGEPYHSDPDIRRWQKCIRIPGGEND